MKHLDVVAALIRKGNKLFLCQRLANDHFGNLWEFPGGAVEQGETFTQAIEREIEEEVGLRVRAGAVVNSFSDENEYLHIDVFLIACTAASGEPSRRDCQDFGYFSYEEAGRLDLAPVDRKILDFLKQTGLTNQNTK